MVKARLDASLLRFSEVDGCLAKVRLGVKRFVAVPAARRVHCGTMLMRLAE